MLMLVRYILGMVRRWYKMGLAYTTTADLACKAWGHGGSDLASSARAFPWLEIGRGLDDGCG